MERSLRAAISKSVPAITFVVIFSITHSSMAQSPNYGAEQEKTKTEELTLTGLSHKWAEQGSTGFLENLGQLINSKYENVPHILFETQAPGINIYITNKGLSYIFINAPKQNGPITNSENNNPPEINSGPGNFEMEYCRMDMFLLGANINIENIIKEHTSKTDYNFFYGSACPKGIYGVKKYNKITISEIYPGIDWVIYTTKGEQGIEYDFIVKPGANPNQIKMKYTGAGHVTHSEQEKLIVSSRLGKITEGKLFIYNNETKKKIVSHYQIENLNNSFEQDNGGVETSIVTFNISTYDNTQTLVIDPKLVWATYYGGNSLETFQSIHTDNSGNLFITGWIVGTSGLFPLLNPGLPSYYQGTMTASSVYALILKFNPSGVLNWATYYGGDTNILSSGIGADNEAVCITNDAIGNVYVTGQTSAKNFPLKNMAGSYNDATLGAATATEMDAFVLKFDNAGTLLWSTFFGGDQNDQGRQIEIDPAQNIIITGRTWSSTGFPLLSSGTAYYQPVYAGAVPGSQAFLEGDLFISKFNSSGILQWSTYYGGSTGEYPFDMDVDYLGNIYVVGWITSAFPYPPPAIPFPTFNPGVGAFFKGTYPGGNYKGFIIEFDNTGILKWATLFGEDLVNGEWTRSVVADNLGNVFVTCNGYKAPNTYPYTDPGGGAWFQTAAGKGDGMIIKFNAIHNVVWCTRFGGGPNGSSSDAGIDMAVDNCNNLYLIGEAYAVNSTFPTTATTGCGSFTQNNSGRIFIAMFSNNGNLLWVSRYGNNTGAFTATNYAYRVCFDEISKSIYMSCGFRLSGIPTVDPGGGTFFRSTWSGVEDGGILKFTHIPPSIVLNSTSSTCLCTGTAISTVTCGIPPYNFNWSGGSTALNLTGLCAGSYSVIVTDAACLKDTAFVTVTGGGISIASNLSNVGCGPNEGSIIITPAGGTTPYTYNWSNGQTTTTITGLSSGNYSVTITDAGGCTTTSSAVIISPSSFTGQFSKGTSTCTGCGCKEWIMVNATGGTSPYSYLWPDGYINRYKNQLCQGIYNITVKDKNGCSININLTAP